LFLFDMRQLFSITFWEVQVIYNFSNHFWIYIR
jgi:hypothetical protein